MKRELRVFSALLISSLLILFFGHLGIFASVKSFSQQFFLNPKKIIYQNWQKIERVRVRDRDRDRVVGELREKVAEQERELATRNSQLVNCQTENTAQRRLLGASLPPDWQFFPAQTAGLIGGQLIIDQGEKQGVKVGQAAIFENILVGKVEKAGERIAWMQLPSNKKSRILVKVIPDGEEGSQRTQSETEGTEKARGLLIGDGEKMRLEKVLQEENLAEGDLVVTADYPPNLLIGKIKKVFKKEAEIYQTAEVEPLVDYQKLEIVFLIR